MNFEFDFSSSTFKLKMRKLGGGYGVQEESAPPAAVTRTGRLMDETGRGPSMLNLGRFEFEELIFLLFSH